MKSKKIIIIQRLLYKENIKQERQADQWKVSQTKDNKKRSLKDGKKNGLKSQDVCHFCLLKKRDNINMQERVGWPLKI